MSLSSLIYHLVADESFRSHIKANPEQALAIAGSGLSREELEVLRSIPWDVPLSVLLHPDFSIGPCGPGWFQTSHSHTPLRLSAAA
jgi:hypothetical protein